MTNRRALATLWFVICIVGLGLTACTSGRSLDRKPSTTDHTDGRAPTLAVDEVLGAYSASWSAFEQALADANPSAPTLAATMVNPELQGVKANLLSDQIHGLIGWGTFILHPKITSLSTTTATVVDCAYSTAELLDRATGKPVPPITPPENDGVTSTLVLTGGTWKVEKQAVTDGSCTPGS